MGEVTTCPNGHGCPPGSAYCLTCGASLSSVVPPVSQPSQIEMPSTLIASPAVGEAAPESAGTPAGSGKRRWLLIGAAAVVVIAIIGVAVFILMGRSSSHPSYGAVGTFVVQPTLDDVSSFSEGLAPAQRDGKWGFIDPTGNFVIAPQFDDASGFSEGLAPVELGDQWGFVDKTGAIVITPQYSYLKYTTFSSGLAPVTKDSKTGYIDTTGTLKISPQYDSAYDFSEDLAPVKIDDKWGYIDPNGKLVIAPQYDSAYQFSEGLALVTVSDKMGFIDTSGAFAVNPQFSDAWSFSAGYAPVQTSGEWGFIDKTGEWTIPAQYEKAYGFSEGLAAVMKDGKWGYIKTSGDFAIEPTFAVKPFDPSASDPLYWISDFTNGVASLMPADSAKVGLIDTEGQWVLQPSYSSIYGCSEGLAAVATTTDSNGYGSGPWGFISCG